VEQQTVMAQHLSHILGDTLLTALLGGQIPQQLPSPQVRTCMFSLNFPLTLLRVIYPGTLF